VDELVDEITAKAQAAVCDNYLQPGGYAFYGAEAVARLYDRRFPAILVTQFLEQDRDTSIRERRQKIPIVLSKEQADPPAIMQGFVVCAREHRGDIALGRRPCRTLIKVARLDPESGPGMVDALVLSWNPHLPVRFPVKIMPDHLRLALAVGQYLIARVNTGAESTADLFFTDFEAAPEPLPEDSLGKG
jgi:hypothetical protein